MTGSLEYIVCLSGYAENIDDDEQLSYCPDLFFWVVTRTWW